MNLNKYYKQYEASHRNPWNKLCHAIGIPLIIASLGWLMMDGPAPLAWGIFVMGWLFQFLGHGIEKTVPEFLKNPLFLLIGPLYFAHKILKRDQLK